MSRNDSHAPAGTRKRLTAVLATVALALGGGALVASLGSPAAAVSGVALINGDTVTGGASSPEGVAAAAQGLTVQVVSGATWSSMTQAQFGTYRVLIIGDPTCNLVAASVFSSVSSWAPVVMGTAGGRTQSGNRVLIGTDPVYHRSGHPGANTLISDGIAFASSQPNRTGVYFDSSCTGTGQTAQMVSTLAALSVGTGAWSISGPPCGGSVAMIASTPLFNSLHTTDLQGWGCSVHESFPTFASDWHPLAIATDTSTKPVCGTDTASGAAACGQAYVLIAGSDIVVTAPNLSLVPTTNTSPAGGTHTVTATVTRSSSPLSGAFVLFTLTGVNAGVAGTCSPNADCTSDASGQVAFTYSDDNGVGDDTINASFTDSASGSLQSATSAQHWTHAAETITVTADDQSTTYGQSDPPFTFTSSSTGADTLTSNPTCGVTGAHSDAGTYPITCSGGSVPAGDTLTFNAGTLTVARAKVVVTGNDATRAYGAANPSLDYTVSGLLGSDTLTTTPACTSTAVDASPVGDYPISCGGAGAGGNYSISYVDGTLSVTKAEIVVTPDSFSIVYGDADPAFTYTVAGLANGDSLTATPTCTVVGIHHNANSYPITCSGASAGGNYSVSYGPGSLTVTQAPVAITPDPQSITYGDADPTFTYTVAGLKSGDSLSTDPTCGVAGAHSDAGSYTITCSGGDAGGNYTLSYDTATLKVAKAEVTITADNQTRTYGSPDATFTYATSGLVGSDSLTTAPTCGVAGAHSSVGSYTISCSSADAGDNYTISYADGTLTVTKASLTITASDGSMTYGGTPPTITAGYSGFVNGDTPASLTAGPTCSTTATSSSPVGGYPSSCSGAVDANYTIHYAGGSVQVNPAKLTITASDGSMPYGSTPPTITASYNGFVNGDNAASLTTKPTCVTTATSSAPVGVYPSSCSGAVDANYTIGYVGGHVTVSKATPAIATVPSGSVPVGGKVSDSATLSGGGTFTGTVSFKLYGPGDNSCATALTTLSGTLSGGHATSPPVTATSAGTYQWVAIYSGDGNNNSVTSACGSEKVVVTPQKLTGRAYGLRLTSPILNVLPVPDTGPASTTASSTIAPPCVAKISGLVGVQAVCAKLVTVTGSSASSTATASVASLTIPAITSGVATIPAFVIRAVQSSSQTTCAGSTGSVTIAYLKVGTTVVISTNTIIKPNTTINVGVVKLVLNEQKAFTTPDKGLTVNAIHINVNALGYPLLDTIISSSESDIGNCP